MSVTERRPASSVNRHSRTLAHAGELDATFEAVDLPDDRVVTVRVGKPTLLDDCEHPCGRMRERTKFLPLEPEEQVLRTQQGP